jgi:hypothetical protein
MWLYSLFNEYWNLYHKVTFDGINKLIIINSDENLIDVQRDIYSAWKEWLLYDNNARYLQAIDTVGGEPTVAGQRLDVTYFLINGWKIKPFSGSYTLNIIGNIFDLDGENIIVPADIITGQPNNININTNTSVIVRRVDGGSGDVNLDEINSKLDNQSIQLVSIENRLFTIENRISTLENNTSDILNILSNPLEVILPPNESDKLNEILNKIDELWKIHGLSPDTLIVNQTSRKVSDIEQIFTKSGDDVLVNRTP